MSTKHRVSPALFLAATSVGDAIFWLLIVISATAAFCPSLGLAAATATIKARRARRFREAIIRASHGEVWARQLLRNGAAESRLTIAIARLWAASRTRYHRSVR